MPPRRQGTQRKSAVKTPRRDEIWLQKEATAGCAARCTRFGTLVCRHVEGAMDGDLRTSKLSEVERGRDATEERGSSFGRPSRRAFARDHQLETAGSKFCGPLVPSSWCRARAWQGFDVIRSRGLSLSFFFFFASSVCLGSSGGG